MVAHRGETKRRALTQRSQRNEHRGHREEKPKSTDPSRLRASRRACATRGSGVWSGGEGQGEEGFLLELVGFGGAGGGAGAGRAFQGAHTNIFGLSNALQAR